LTHAGRQDIEARLWEDPFTAMRQVKGRSPRNGARKRSRTERIIRRAARIHRVPRQTGTCHFRLACDGPRRPVLRGRRGRRRSRYAVVSALLQSGGNPQARTRSAMSGRWKAALKALGGLAPELLLTSGSLRRQHRRHGKSEARRTEAGAQSARALGRRGGGIATAGARIERIVELLAVVVSLAVGDGGLEFAFQPMRKRRWRTACRNADCASSRQSHSPGQSCPGRPTRIPRRAVRTGRCVATLVRNAVIGPATSRRSKQSYVVSPVARIALERLAPILFVRCDGGTGRVKYATWSRKLGTHSAPPSFQASMRCRDSSRSVSSG